MIRNLTAAALHFRFGGTSGKTRGQQRQALVGAEHEQRGGQRVGGQAVAGQDRDAGDGVADGRGGAGIDETETGGAADMRVELQESNREGEADPLR